MSKLPLKINVGGMCPLEGAGIYKHTSRDLTGVPGAVEQAVGVFSVYEAGHVEFHLIPGREATLVVRGMAKIASMSSLKDQERCWMSIERKGCLAPKDQAKTGKQRNNQ